ncbi:lanthionine synthetase LanC family protein [Flammeovirga sp. OC4]|uniref:lanthionine synthetase LanC family protein n=1 Tax=Flammeovirga sp. OC4 TaxID=1382345 RepID=UPI0012DFF048|nr:lanthionine synthetase LanC family protein [Flammeovirga sp. OC4]
MESKLLINNIQDKVKTRYKELDSTLFKGKSGYSLFLVYTIKLSKNKKEQNIYIEELNKVNDLILENCLESKLPEILLGGKAGILMNFNELFENKLIDQEDHQIISLKLQEHFPSNINDFLSSKNYDLFYGTIGCLVSTLTSNTYDKHLISSVIDQLNQHCSKSSSFLLFEGEKNEKMFTGLAHGFCMLIAFCLKCYEKEISQDKCKNIIYGFIGTLKHLKNKNSSSIYNFPQEFDKIDEKNMIYHNRLAWCHGDLGISVTLVRCGITLNDQEIFNLGLETALKCADRSINEALLVKYENTEIYDIGLCHGLSSITHLFFRLYYYTKNKIIKERYIFWKETLIQNTEMVLANFDSIEQIMKKNDDYSNDIFSMLNGIIGAGLVIASHETEENFSWDEIMLLS